MCLSFPSSTNIYKLFWKFTGEILSFLFPSSVCSSISLPSSCNLLEIHFSLILLFLEFISFDSYPPVAESFSFKTRVHYYYLLTAFCFQAHNLEKILWEGEFTLRSDPWAGLIASCGSFYPMVCFLIQSFSNLEFTL